MKQLLFNAEYLSKLPISCQFISLKPILLQNKTVENTNILVVSQLCDSWVIAHPPYKVINPKKNNIYEE